MQFSVLLGVFTMMAIVFFGRTTTAEKNHLPISSASTTETVNEEQGTTTTTTTITSSSSLNMTVCADKCQGGDCRTYITPVDECFSSATLFPDDSSWSGLDVYDRLIGDDFLLRTIYHTADGSCTPSSSSDDDDDDDHFQIDLNVCVGPFGRPRPWGIFSILPTTITTTTTTPAATITTTFGTNTEEIMV